MVMYIASTGGFNWIIHGIRLMKERWTNVYEDHKCANYSMRREPECPLYGRSDLNNILIFKLVHYFKLYGALRSILGRISRAQDELFARRILRKSNFRGISYS